MRWIAVSFRQARNLQEARPQFDTDRLFELVARFSPTVCWRQDQHHEHAGWLVEVHSSLRLFGGAHALLAQLWQQVEELSLDIQLATYSTASGAWWLSKASPACTETDFLSMLELQEKDLLRLPVTVLDTDQKMQTTWQQCGFDCVGDLWQLPRASFLKRFGQIAMAELDSGMGIQSRLAPGHGIHTPPEVFDQSLELPFHSNRLDLIERHAHLLLKSVCNWMKQNKTGTRELQWTLLQANQQSMLQLRSAQATRCEQTWQQLLHHQLGRMKFQQDVHSLQLKCLNAEQLPDQGGQLLPDPSQAHRNWNSTCDLLRARLGEQTVLFASTDSDPRPECSIVLQATPIARSVGPGTKKLAGLQTPELDHTQLQASTPRPLWLLPTPRKLQGKPPGWQSVNPWQLMSGPERVEFGWWDSKPCKRDYYCARDSNNSLVWLYQDMLDDSGQWFLHGYFA